MAAAKNRRPDAPPRGGGADTIAADAIALEQLKPPLP
jgi:hypothetical protein